MVQHSSTNLWQREDNAGFTDHRYSRRHTWHFDRGAVVPGSSSPYVVPLPYSDAEAVGTLARNADGQQAMTCVVLRPAVQFAPGKVPTAEDLHALHHRAHASCFIANSVKTEVLCEPVL